MNQRDHGFLGWDEVYLPVAEREIARRRRRDRMIVVAASVVLAAIVIVVWCWVAGRIAG